MALDNYCELCDKNFCNPSALKRHLKCHDEDWTLKCDDCGHRTKRSDYLKEHKERYHPNNAFEPTRALETADVPVAAKKTIGVSPVQPMEVEETGDFDLKLQLPNNFVYAGSTQSGKTILLMKTLENAHDIYNPAPSKVVFLYGCWQDIYNNLRDSLKTQGIKIEFRQEGIITKDDLEAMADPNGGQTMIVIDDNSIVASENKDVVDAFTKARHNNCSIVLLLHFIFGNQNLAKIRANTMDNDQVVEFVQFVVPFTVDSIETLVNSTFNIGFVNVKFFGMEIYLKNPQVEVRNRTLQLSSDFVFKHLHTELVN